MTLYPLSYDITIIPNLNAFTFDGSVAININCSQSTDELWLYVSMLEFDLKNVILMELDNMQQIPILSRTTATNQSELSIFKLDGSLTPGMSYQIKFTSFKGIIENGGVGLFNVNGLYAINFTNSGLPEIMFVTMGECCYIRRIFPSFDEPNFRAEFQLTLVVPEKYTVTSNTKPQLTQIENGQKTVKFEKTKPMASYLLAFSIFKNFFSSSVLSPDFGYNVTAWIRSELAEQIVETSAFEATVLDFYSNYFNFAFPYAKLDMIIEPFQPYSEEDWGQITYGESMAILNPQMAPSVRTTPLVVIAHETGHQWSGDLVTCSWWSDTWLNEGFATFISTIGSRIYTNFSDEIFWLNGQLSAFDLDTSRSTRPLIEFVPNINDIIMDHFGSLTYRKGATMLNMIRWLLQEEKFQAAMSEYFRTFAYQSVITEDFLKVMDQFSLSFNFSSLMQSWLYNAGFPLVTATRDGAFINLQQDPFTNYHQTSNDFIWSIPLWYQNIFTQDQNIFTKDQNIFTENRIPLPDFFLFNQKSARIKVGSDLVIFNPDAKSMVMVNYDFETWRNISHLLNTNHEQLSPLTRAHLLHTAFTLYSFRKVNCTVLSELSQYLGKETEYSVWETILSHSSLFFPPSCGFSQKTLQNFVNSVFNIIGLSLNYPSHFPDLLSEMITRLACHYGNNNCTTPVLNFGQIWFQCIQESGNDFNNCTNFLPPPHRAPIYCELAKNSTEAFKYLEDRLCSATYPLTDKDDLTYGLKCAGWIKCPGNINVPKFKHFIYPRILEPTTTLPKTTKTTTSPLSTTSKTTTSPLSTTSKTTKTTTSPLSTTSPSSTTSKTTKTTTSPLSTTSKTTKTITSRTTTSPLSTTTPAPRGPPRIPLTLMPTNYILTIQPNFTSYTFAGQVIITIECRQVTNELWLYAAMLKFSLSDMTLISKTDGQMIGILSYEVVFGPPELFIYKLDQFLIPNKTYELKINYQGEIETGGAGLSQNFGIYSIDFLNAGKNQTMFISLGECCYERRIFPNFDEPNFKAPTQLTLITPEKFTVTSNTPIFEEKIENGLKTTKFFPTKPIVSYLVAFAIFENFSKISAISNSGINVTAWFRSDISEMTVDSAKFGASLLDYYKDYFGVDYPYPKMDYILMPEPGTKNKRFFSSTENFSFSNF